MPPNAAPATQSITETLIATSNGGISDGSPKVFTEPTTGVLFEQDAETIDGGLVKDIGKLKIAEKRKLKLVWRNIIIFGYLHLAALYGAYLMITSAKWQTVAFVPKKVNRHVLKAVNNLCTGSVNKNRSATLSQILQSVKYQMRNLVPVRNVDMVIQKSVKNLSDIGLIIRNGTNSYTIGESYVPPASRKSTTNRNLFKPSGSRKRSISHLNPNSKRSQYDSDDSLSGDEYDRSRKLLRTNKRVKRSGRSTELPKSRQHQLKNVWRNLSNEMAPVFNYADTPSADLSTFVELQPPKMTEIGCEANLFDKNINMAANISPENNITGNLPSAELWCSVSGVQKASIDCNVVELYNRSNSFMENLSTTNSNSATTATNSLKRHPSSEKSVNSETIII